MSSHTTGTAIAIFVSITALAVALTTRRHHAEVNTSEVLTDDQPPPGMA